MDIYQSIQQVPDVIWSGVIASVLTLSGVLISNRSNTTRLVKQLNHDRDEKIKERTLNLRREVTLAAIEEMVKLNRFLILLPENDIKNFEHEFANFQVAFAKLQLVAEPRTSLLATRIASAYSELGLEFMEQLMDLQSAKTTVQILDDNFTQVHKETQRILSEMTRQNESGRPDSIVFEALEQNFQWQAAQSSKLLAQRKTAWEELIKNNIVYIGCVLKRLREITPLQMQLIIEIRKDLALTGDLSEVENEIHLLLTRWLEKWGQVVNLIESRLN